MNRKLNYRENRTWDKTMNSHERLTNEYWTEEDFLSFPESGGSCLSRSKQWLDDSVKWTGRHARRLLTRRDLLKDTLLYGLLGLEIYEHSIAATMPRATAAMANSIPGPASESIESEQTPLLVLPKFSFLCPIRETNPSGVPSSRLPNATRAYRHGTHNGIDLYVPYDTPVRAIADGLITRSDSAYAELDQKMHSHLLEQSRILRETPSDAIERLKGRCVEIDHGEVEGFRIRSIYAHLSEASVAEGESVRRGDTIAATGNSGTSAGVNGTREDAHLHLEVRLQLPSNSEFYLGQGLPEGMVRHLLKEVFRHA
jgi:murein DD-endopeptidase MepM/ murein hydrolase activator NlpD